MVQASYLTIFALAQTVVILTRGFDLSLGFTVSLVSVATGMATLLLAAGFVAVVALLLPTIGVDWKPIGVRIGQRGECIVLLAASTILLSALAFWGTNRR